MPIVLWIAGAIRVCLAHGEAFDVGTVAPLFMAPFATAVLMLVWTLTLPKPEEETK